MYLFFLIYFIIFFKTVKLEKIEVKLNNTIIKGHKESTVIGYVLYYAFYRVPYAEPPIKNLRYKDPKPVMKRRKYIDARVQYYGACAQGHIVHRKGIYGVEDCLYLNIYTPQLPSYRNENLKAVLIWFHGYAFTSSISHLYGPDFFILNDIVFVSVAYRVGPFGFLNTHDGIADENVGLKDIILALKWVRKNIRKFGGDQRNISVMGFDSGGTLLTFLLATSYRRLFSKIILHSSSIFLPSLYRSNSLSESTILQNLLNKTKGTDIKTASANDVIEIAYGIYNVTDITRNQRPIVPFIPTIDMTKKKVIVKKRPEQLMKEQNLNIPILMGFNSQESVSEIVPFLNDPLLLKKFEKDFKYMVPFSEGCSYEYDSKTYKRVAHIIKKNYFRGTINELSIKPFVNYTRQLETYPIFHFIKKISEINQNTTFVYKFHYRGQLNSVTRVATQNTNINLKGSAKGDELCYLFRCEPLNKIYSGLSKENDDDKMIIKEMSSLWANFIKHGNPTPDNKLNFTWLPFSSTYEKILSIDKTKEMITPVEENLMYTFWNKVFNDYYHKRHCIEQFRDEL